ncbi:MAG: DUF234 domain-containing protein [Nanobdellota archaeon]
MDNLFSFWFKFCEPDKSSLSIGDINPVIKKIKQNFNSYLGFKFEDICRDYLRKEDYEKIGRWWHKEQEIDIVALNEEKKEILFAECKWKDNVDGNKLLTELKNKTKLVNWYNEERKEKHLIFAKSFKNKSKGMFDLKDIGKVLL